jgi:hypothetical protein
VLSACKHHVRIFFLLLFMMKVRKLSTPSLWVTTLIRLWLPLIAVLPSCPPCCCCWGDFSPNFSWIFYVQEASTTTLFCRPLYVYAFAVYACFYRDKQNSKWSLLKLEWGFCWLFIY